MKTCFCILKLSLLLLCTCVVFGEEVFIHRKNNTTEFDVTVVSNGTNFSNFAVLAQVTFTATISATTMCIIYVLLAIATKLYNQKREDCFVEMV